MNTDAGKMIERVVRFTVNGEAMPSFLCTPDALCELAVGYLLTQGHIGCAKDVTSVSEDGLSVAVTTRLPIAPAPQVEARIAAMRPVAHVAMPSAEEVAALMGALMAQDEYHGTHTLGLETPGGTVFRQDIGRHNAMDKVVGRAAMDGVDFSRCRAVATGRISLEMLLKAASVGIPVILSKKYPSDMAAELAAQAGITIIGHALRTPFIVYATQC